MVMNSRFDDAEVQPASVVVHGRAQAVEEPDEVSRLWAVSGVPWAGGVRNLFIRITPTRLSGRAVAARPR